jgi:hypothetical protein
MAPPKKIGFTPCVKLEGVELEELDVFSALINGLQWHIIARRGNEKNEPDVSPITRPSSMVEPAHSISSPFTLVGPYIIKRVPQ